MASKQKILIVDDDTNISELIALYLTKECFETMCVEDGEAALKACVSFKPDLILLDLMLPGMDGYQVCREVRKTSSTPIIMLSAKGEVFDKVLGLELGADDYMIKPFDSKELVARVKSHLRRYMQLGSTAIKESEAIYTVGGLAINDDLKEVTVDGEPVKLTPIEYNILLLLVKHQGKVFSIDQIYENIWNENAVGVDNTVAVHIRHIREKIEINPKEPRYLKVVWGVGYKIEKQ